MNRTAWLILLTFSAWWLLGMASQPPGAARPVQDRGRLPFSEPPQRRAGPPRAPGELPQGRSLPPSTLPGRRSGPPRAQGMVPAPVPPGPSDDLPSPFRPFVLPRVDPLPPALGPQRRRDDPLRLPLDLDPFASPGPLPTIEPGEPAAETIRDLVNPLELRSSDDILDERSPLLPGLPTTPGDRPVEAPPLILDEVLASAERSYPPFLESLQERAIASGELRSAFGAFDLNINADARNWALGFYRRYLYDAFVEQPTPYWGATFFGGYRLALGNWPIYYQYLDTLNAGAYVAGLELPLLRGREIDSRRAGVWQAELERRRVEPAVSRARIDLVRDASIAFWDWLATGQQFLAFERLLRVAEGRSEFLARQVELGLVPPTEVLDNQRVVLQRQALLLDARQRFQDASLELALYLRDGRGLPMIPPSDRLPPAFPRPEPPDPSGLPQDLDAALRLRPELRELRLQAQVVGVDRRLAENRLLPELNLYVYAEQNTGPPVPFEVGAKVSTITSQEIERNLAPFILESSLLFEVPLQRRQARGRLQVADARLRQIELRERITRDRVVLDVKQAVVALQTSYARVLRNEQAVEANRRLELAEQRRLELGLSNVLVVNLREQATADALAETISALNQFYRALADYRAALALDALPPSDEATGPLVGP